MGAAYQAARLQAMAETDISEETFPDSNPFTWAEVMDDAFWPEAPASK